MDRRTASQAGRGTPPPPVRRSGSATRTSAPDRPPVALRKPPTRPSTRDQPQGRRDDDGWTPGGPASRPQQRATRAADARIERSLREMQSRSGTPERGWPWWAAILVLIGIAVVGGVIDTVGDVTEGFNFGIVIASIIAILIVKRSQMFSVVISPPIIYSLGAVFQLYLRSNGLNDKKVVLDAAANYLVYGFPAIAGASAAVLLIAGIRLIARR